MQRSQPRSLRSRQRLIGLAACGLSAVCSCSKGGVVGDGEDGARDLASSDPGGRDLAMASDAAASADLASPDLAKPPTGSVVWTKTIAAEVADYDVVAVATDSLGSVIVAGSFQGTIDFGGGPLQSAGKQDGFLVKFDSGGRHLYSKRFGSAEADRLYAVAVGPGDLIAVTGSFSDKIDLGGGVLTSAGVSDIVLGVFDAGGSHLYSKRFGAESTDEGYSIAFAPDGDLVIAGRIASAVDFGSGPQKGGSGYSGFVARFRKDGTPRYSRAFGGMSLATAFAVGVQGAGAGNVLLGGSFNYDADFGGGRRYTNGFGDVTAFLAGYSGETGAWRFDRTYYEVAHYARNITQAIAALPSGAAVAVGQFDGSVDFGTGKLTSSATQSDVFVARLDKDGVVTSARRYGGADYDGARGVALSASGELAVAGMFLGTSDYGTGPLTSAGKEDAFVARYDASGTPIYTRRYGGAKSDAAYGTAIAPDGAVVVVGTFQDSADFGAGPVTAKSNRDLFVVRLAP